MGLQQKVKLELEDGSEIETVYDGRDLRAWETRTGKSALVEPMSISLLTFLGWSAGKRDGSLNGAYDKYEAFDKVCVNVAGVREDDAEANPTKPRAARTRKSPSAD